MRAIFLLVLLFGMALAGLAVYMVRQQMGQTETLLARERALNAKAGKLVEVFVFARDLTYGEPLTEDAVQLIFWPESALPESIFRDKAALFPQNATAPRYLTRAAQKFEPVLASRVTEPGELAGLTAKLKPGMRAFAIKVNVASGVAAFVQPDDFVDINWTGDVQGSTVTRMIESSIQVIAVDQAFNEGQLSGDEVNTVTVGATPEQVARLTLAQATGQLSMSLVGATPETTAKLIEIDTNAMLGIVQQTAVEPPPPVQEKICTRKERKGVEVVEKIVPCNR